MYYSYFLYAYFYFFRIFKSNRTISAQFTHVCFVQALIVTLWLNCDRFFQRLNTAATNDASTQSIIAEFFHQ